MQSGMRQKGFTLVELMIAVVLVAIVSVLAAPSFRTIIQNNRRSTDVNMMVSTLSLARSEAVKRGQTVSICSSNNSNACGGTWSDGWLVFADDDSDGDRGNTEQIIRVQRNTDPQFAWTSAAFPSFLSYSASGLGNGPGNFLYCDSRGAAQARALFVSRTGSVRLSSDSNGDGIHDDGTNPLNCP